MSHQSENKRKLRLHGQTREVIFKVYNYFKTVKSEQDTLTDVKIKTSEVIDNAIMKRLVPCRHIKLWLTVLMLMLVMFVFLQINVSYQYSHQYLHPYIKYNIVITKDIEDEVDNSVEEWLKLRKNQTNLSKLGRILFLEEEKPIVTINKNYQILVWKYGHLIEKRLVYQYTKNKLDPFRKCSVNNCNITYEDSAINTADIVIIHLHRTKSPLELPKKRGKEGQIWAFLTDESPCHTFIGSNQVTHNGINYTIEDFNGIFNWSMSYRTDSDIPVPYGRTVIKRVSRSMQSNINKQRNILIAMMVSNCRTNNHRWNYVRELQKHIKVDVYGHCGKFKCPGYYGNDCPLLENYLFYLSFENSNCDEYITEKLWWHAFQKSSIPIVMGGSQKTYKRILPPNSYLHVEDFSSPSSLARFVLRLNETDEFLNYYKWKKHFEVLNEHGYFGSSNFHYCRICEALNYNDKSQKIYTNLEKNWNYQNVCYSAWDAPR